MGILNFNVTSKNGSFNVLVAFCVTDKKLPSKIWGAGGISAARHTRSVSDLFFHYDAIIPVIL